MTDDGTSAAKNGGGEQPALARAIAESRDHLERELWKLTQWRGAAAEIDRFLDMVDDYAEVKATKRVELISAELTEAFEAERRTWVTVLPIETFDELEGELTSAPDDLAPWETEIVGEEAFFADLMARIEAKRNDQQFMTRVTRIIQQNEAALTRLGWEDGGKGEIPGEVVQGLVDLFSRPRVIPTIGEPVPDDVFAEAVKQVQETSGPLIKALADADAVADAADAADVAADMVYLTCSKCHRSKPETAFYRDRHKASGRRGACKDCDAKAKSVKYTGVPAKSVSSSVE